MNDIVAVLAVLAGIATRLVIPILVTAVVVFLLRLLDARWQSEGQTASLNVEKPACWEVMGCSPEARQSCPGYLSPLPCWQARRTENGYLRQECLACRVFIKAPVPVFGR